MDAVLIAAGVYLSARIVSFIAGELTELELRKQREIDEEIERIRSKSLSSELEEQAVARAHASDEVIVRRKEIASYLSNEARQRIADIDSLRHEIGKSIGQVQSAIRSRDQISTPLRKTSLELLLRQLYEAKEKSYAYKIYLRAYVDMLDSGQCTDSMPVFYMQLPRGYPYKGKVIWIDAGGLSSGHVEYDAPGMFSVPICVTDKRQMERTNQDVVPLMITGVQKRRFYGSLEKGAFKAYELTNTHLGVEATVKVIRRDSVVLTYWDDLSLFLPRDNLIMPDRFPPVRSNLTVYPVWWRYDLVEDSSTNGNTKFPVTVSERREDAGSALSFESFPLCFSAEELSTFSSFYNEMELQDYDEELLIGPVSSRDIALRRGSLLKLQLGSIPLIVVEVEESSDRSDAPRFFFKFHHMCSSGEKTFSADDIFLPFDVTIAPYVAGTSIEMIRHYMEIDDIGDVAALIWDLFEEFRIQDQMKRDREGVTYFQKWESLTDQLISVLEQGDSYAARIRWVDTGGRNVRVAEVLNPSDLELFVESFSRKMDMALGHKWTPRFFVKDGEGNRYFTTIDESGKRLRIVGRDVAKALPERLTSVDVFASNHPYAEYQQKRALRQFRIGQVVNPLIQAACLNSSTIVSDRSDDSEIPSLHNELLSNNSSQRRSVELAYRERNIFFIQGPPGSGKTTVIRELVEQTLASRAESRVLIVSQANVAVDNALSGLIGRYREQIVRCGSKNKITPEFRPLWLEAKCQDYLDALRKRKDEFDEGFFESWQSEILRDEDSTFSPVLCELVVRSHRLVGATCVGLAKRRIGLERAEFDLVIIDEAGKALPAEMLIPLLRAKKAVIIGDQNQLPPVINPILYDEEQIDLEERAVSENDLFCHSFFERLYDNAPDTCKIMLDTQFRMPAVIGTAISELFYEGKLKNGKGTEAKRPVLYDTNLSFINYDGNRAYRETKDEHSQITNSVEARAAASLVASIRRVDAECSIAVITPYKGQRRLIMNGLVRAGIHPHSDGVFVDTVDSFQGNEADVVIFCTTRAWKPTTFFRNTKRINVALSRARRELIILGRLGYFYRYRRGESCLPALADFIRKHGSVIEYDKCQEVQESHYVSESEELMVPVEEVLLPDRFYEEEFRDGEVQKKMEEYYENGDFLMPVAVERIGSGFLLKDGFAQFRAAQALELEECLCHIVPR